MAKAKGNKDVPQSPESIVAHFQQLRSEQRSIIAKIAELEGENSEHKLVVDALKGVDPERRCFRMVGGVLVERTVKDVQPALQHNIDQLVAVVDKLKMQLEEKGKVINAYREKHGIRVRGESERSSDQDSAHGSSGKQTQGILVS